MILTQKQRQIMSCIISGNVDCIGKPEQWLNVHDIRKAVSYDCSRESMMCSLRFLSKKGLIEKGEPELRDSRWVTPILPTALALEIIPRIDPNSKSVSYFEDTDTILEGF